MESIIESRSRSAMWAQVPGPRTVGVVGRERFRRKSQKAARRARNSRTPRACGLHPLRRFLERCPRDIEEILEKIATVLGTDVVVERVEKDWVQFRAVGLTDWCATAQIIETWER